MNDKENEIIEEGIINKVEVINESRGHRCCSGHGNQMNMKKHFLHMILCCGIPMVILLFLPMIARFNPWVAGALGLITPFICPIIMGGMLFMAFKSIK